MKYFSLLLRLAVSAGLVAVLLPRFTSGLIDRLLDAATAQAVVLAVLLLVLQAALAAVRQRVLLGLMGGSISWPASLRIWFDGLFASQMLVTFVLGDVVRGVRFAQLGIGTEKAVRTVVLDRAVGLVALLVLTLFSIVFIIPLAADSLIRAGLQVLAVGSAVAVGAFFACSALNGLASKIAWPPRFHRPIGIAADLLSISRYTMSAPASALAAFGLSAAMHLLNVAAIVVIGLVLGMEAPLWPAAMILIPVTLLMILPISFAGWGVREAAMVTGLALVGVPEDLALATSISFGLAMLLVSLPGAVSLLLTRVTSAAQPAPAFPAVDH